MTNMEDTDKYPTQPLPRFTDEPDEPTMPATGPTEVDIPGPPGMRVTRMAYTEPAFDEEKIITPPPRPPLPAATGLAAPSPRSPGLLRFLVGLCLVISLASLALTILVIYSAMGLQRTAVSGLDAAIGALDNLQGQGFHYDYRFEKTIPVSSSIPINQDMVFPFSGDFPINTTVRVPIDAGVLGKFTIDVPINTSVRIDTEVPIHIEQTFHISTSIPVSMSIPIDVRTEDPQIRTFLDNLRAWLLELRQAFNLQLLPARGRN